MNAMTQDEARTAFERDLPESRHEDVMTMLSEAAQDPSCHRDHVTILEQDRLDAINVRAHGVIQIGGAEHRFIIEDGNRNGTVLIDWDGDRVFKPAARTQWALQPAQRLIAEALKGGRGSFLLWKWEALLKNRPEVAAIPGKYAYDRMVQPGIVTERHWREMAEAHQFEIVTQEEASETKRRLAGRPE